MGGEVESWAAEVDWAAEEAAAVTEEGAAEEWAAEDLAAEDFAAEGFAAEEEGFESKVFTTGAVVGVEPLPMVAKTLPSGRSK